MPLSRRSATEPTEAPELHPFDQISETTIRDAEAGGDILNALAQLLENAGTRRNYVLRVQNAARAITEITEQHSHAAGPESRRYDLIAQGEHEQEISSHLAQKLFQIELSTGPLRDTSIIAEHSSWRQDVAGRIYDTDGVLLAQSLDDLHHIMRQLGWFVPSSAHAAGIHWLAVPSGQNENVERADEVRAKARELGY